MENENVLKEFYKKQEKCDRLFTNYRMNVKEPVVTGKFYARHEAQVRSVDNEQLKLFVKKLTDGPKEKYPNPQTENQSYGWNITPFIHHRDKNIMEFRRKKEN